jgi:hypothetical protein
MGNWRSGVQRGSFSVYELRDPSGPDADLPRYIGIAKAGSDPAEVWACRAELGNRLGEWLRSLDASPAVVWLVSGLFRAAAEAVAAGRIAWIRESGGDFLLNAPRANTGKRGTPTVALVDGMPMAFPSRAAAGRALGLDPSTISTRI